MHNRLAHKIHGNHLYRCLEIGSASKLDTALQHSAEKVAGVADTGFTMACYPSWPVDRYGNALGARSLNQPFGDPLALSIPALYVLRVIKRILFVDGLAARRAGSGY